MAGKGVILFELIIRSCCFADPERTIQGESKKSDDCDMYNRNVIPCGV